MLQKLAPKSFEQVKSLVSGLGAILTLTSPLFGALADRRRPARKAVFITSLLIAVLGLVVMAFGGNDLYIYCTVSHPSACHEYTHNPRYVDIKRYVMGGRFI